MLSRREQLRKALELPESLCVMTKEPEAEMVESTTPHDPAAWAEDFHRWALDRCVWRDRCFGGIGALHTCFCEWAIAHKSVPMQRTTFERLLRDHGFFFADGLVYGLLLAEDVKPGCILHPDVLLGEESDRGQAKP